ncbi:MAG: formylglycine-generating enzyme family protein, partial [Puniceicoccales bacterium]|nr:formylglycine-generating enzyme family protein [Puniceicoccales bacterium]
SAEDKGEYAKAEKLFAEARALEDRIAGEFSLGNKKDIGRVAHLDQKVRLMQAKPLAESARALEKEAGALYAQKNWNQAADKYQEAYEKEMVLRDKYMGLLPTEYGRATRLLSLGETARAMPEYEKIEASAKEAEMLSKAGKLEESEKKWDEVLLAQENLTKLHPQSEYAGKENLDRLKNWRDKDLSASGVAHFTEGLAKLNGLIRAGKSDEAGNLALSLHQEGNRLVEKFPSAVPVDKVTLTKLQYIGFKARDMALVQDKFLSLLKPVPGKDGIRMMYHEVSQILYSAIMEGENPSASRGDTLPVDSVTYDEAEEFCRRISWLTGRLVRLPMEAEFKQAVGTVAGDVLPGQVWSIENSDGRTHPVATSKPNANGFYDLLGNVSEWLLADLANPGALVGGGDCQTGLDEISQVTTVNVLKKDKSRLRGFRVVVDENGKK